jgi:hypothetical protein
LSYFPRIQKEDGTKTKPAFSVNCCERGQSHISLESTFAIIILQPTFVPKLQPSPRIPAQLPQISFAILLAIQLHVTNKPNPYTTTNNHLSSRTPANNISHRKFTNMPTKSRAKQSTSTSTSTTKPRIFPAGNKLSNLRNYPYHYRRFKPNLREQKTKARTLSPSQSCSS